MCIFISSLSIFYNPLSLVLWDFVNVSLGLHPFICTILWGLRFYIFIASSQFNLRIFVINCFMVILACEKLPELVLYLFSNIFASRCISSLEWVLSLLFSMCVMLELWVIGSTEWFASCEFLFFLCLRCLGICLFRLGLVVCEA